ncbi:MAG: M20/M25/M40 family metallo-hydrolase [Chloroflexota bacterium]
MSTRMSLPTGRVLPRIAILLWLSLVMTGCSLMQPQPQLIIPTPPAGPEITIPDQPAELIFDPVSDVVPGADPQIERLLQEVSQQQLMAYIRQLESFGTRNSFSDFQSEVWGIGAAKRWLFNEFVRVGNGRLTVEFQDFPLSHRGFFADQSNVVATLPGKAGEDGMIVVMAHYDNRSYEDTDGNSRATGANDNGSGIALLLETARVMSSREWNQTIVFLATAAEEQGAFGARFFAETAFLDGKNIIAAINYDGVGGRTGVPYHVRSFAVDYKTSIHGALGRYFEYVTGLYLPTFPVVIYDALDREGRFGDHREFVRVGFPAIRIIESIEDPQLLNSNLDTWDRIDYNYLQQVVRLNVSVLANLAGAPHQPLPPIVNPMAETGSYLLTWPVDPDAAGYAISFRPVDSPYYPTFRFVKASKAGNVALTGLNPNETYGVSISALSENGLVSGFSREFFIGPNAASINALAQQ